jgi:hypothetical protein
MNGRPTVSARAAPRCLESAGSLSTMHSHHQTLCAALSALTLLGAGHATATTGDAVTVAIPATRATAPLDGRVILLISHDLKREPRTHVSAEEMLDSPYLFGMNIDGLAADRPVRFGNHRAVFGWPARTLSAVPPGDYLVQAVLNRYESFHLADGRVLKLPPDRGEGQQWATKPGNLYSTPVHVRVDATHRLHLTLSLDNEVGPVTRKSDTEFVRHIRIRSERLSKFWGRDVYLGAHVLVPKDFDAHPEARYPLMVFHGHYPDDIRDFRTTPPDPTSSRTIRPDSISPVTTASSRRKPTRSTRNGSPRTFRASSSWRSSTPTRTSTTATPSTPRTSGRTVMRSTAN